jgi:hypothetical protein
MAVKTKSQLDALTNDALVVYIDSLSKADFTYIDVDTKVRYFIYKYGKGVAVSIKGTSLFFPAVMAQAIFESNYGKSIPPGSNNFAGIKYNPAVHKDYVIISTSEVVNGVKKIGLQKFAKFATVEEGFFEHVKVLLGDRYKNARIQAKTPAQQIVMIINSGYASLSATKYLEGVQGNINRITKKTGILRIV